MIVIITGSREFSSRQARRAVDGAMFSLPERPTFVLEGGARGIDTAAKLWRQERGIEGDTMDAEWGVYGRTAGHRRNAGMVKRIMEMAKRTGERAICLAFPHPTAESRGTRGCMEIARKAGLEVWVWDAVGRRWEP